MTDEQSQMIANLVTSGSWKEVEKVFLEHMNSLDSITGLDKSLDPQEMMIELKARMLAKDKLEEILMELNAYGLQNQGEPVPRSFR